MKAAAIIVTLLAVLAFVAAVTFGILGIWTGDERFGGTAGVSVFVTLVLGFTSAPFWWAVSDNK